MKLTMLGTGNALVTECYNTCFLIEDNGQVFMVDGGGGNTILRQIKYAGYDWMDMRHIFVTHKHVDHLMGIIWMVRMICQFMRHGKGGFGKSRKDIREICKGAQIDEAFGIYDYNIKYAKRNLGEWLDNVNF